MVLNSPNPREPFHLLEFSEALGIMIFCPTGYHFYAANGAAVCGDDSPAVFALDRNFFAVQITFQIRIVRCEFDPAFELFSHCHKKLVVRLDIVFPDLTDGDTTGEGNALVQR